MKKNRADYIFKGVLPLVFASVLWGCSYAIRKTLLSDFGNFTILFFYSAAAGVFLSLIGHPRLKGLPKRFRANWKPLTLMSFMSAAMGGLLMNVGLQHIDLGVACLLERMQAIFTIILAALLLGEKLTKRSIALGLIGLIAAFFVMPIHFGTNAFEMSWRMIGGAGCVAAAAFSWSVSSIIGRQLAMKNIKPFDMAIIRAIFGVLIMLPLARAFDQPIDLHTEWKDVVLASIGGVIGGAIGYSIYYYALRKVSAGVSGILETVTPVTAVILGITVLGEHLSPVQWSAAAVLLASLTGLILIESKRGSEIGLETQV